MIRLSARFLRRALWGALGLTVALVVQFAKPAGPQAEAMLGPKLVWAQQTADEKRAQDLARTIMSPFCPGRTLEACPSPYATEWREDIREWVREGVSSEEIRDRLKARMPERDLTGAPSTMADAFLPALLLVFAVTALVLLLRKLIRPSQPESAPSKPTASKARADAALEKRLDEELDALDD